MNGFVLHDKLFQKVGHLSEEVEALLRIIAFKCVEIHDLIKDNLDYKSALHALIDWISQFPHIPKLGEAFWKTSMICTEKNMKLLLHLCAVTCMYNIARTKLCIILKSSDSKTAKALRTNSLLELVEAVFKQQ